jgi:hypothetical protein
MDKTFAMKALQDARTQLAREVMRVGLDAIGDTEDRAICMKAAAILFAHHILNYRADSTMEERCAEAREAVRRIIGDMAEAEICSIFRTLTEEA